MSDADDLDIQAERVRAAGALGRSPVVHRLFDYLLERSREEPAPKETEVAEAVFGRRPGFDVSQDSTVRVYVHRLRSKLHEFYRGPGKDEAVRLTIPKGEYRLIALPAEIAEAQMPAPAVRWPLARMMMIGLAAIIALNIAIGALLWWRASDDGFAFARRSPAWSGLIQNDRPITLVVGDYYIFGEADEHADVIRLIREYAINSPEDLANYLMNNPDLVGKYTDLDLHYLPVSIATALRNLMPLLASTPAQRERIRVVSASDLTPDMLKRSNIVYVGYISGLGLLREPVFAGSRLRIGETFDELIDEKSGQTYVSQEGGPEMPSETRRDYGYFSTFDGPNGNKIVIVAGTRDVAVMQTAEVLSSHDGIKAINKGVKGEKAFEALYEVEAINRVNLRGRLLFLSPLKAGGIWDGATATYQKFPLN